MSLLHLVLSLGASLPPSFATHRPIIPELRGIPELRSARPQEPRARPSLDDACRGAYEALSSGRFELLEAAFPTVAEMGAIIDADIAALSKQQQSNARRRIEEQGGAAGVRTDALAKLQRRFDATRAEVAGRFEWAEATYLCALPPAPPARRLAGTDFEVAPAEFLVAARGEVWSFGAQDVLHWQRGWAFMEFLTFRGRRVLEAPEGDRADDRGAQGDATAQELQLQLDVLRHEHDDLRSRLQQALDELEQTRADGAAALVERLMEIEVVREERDGLTTDVRRTSVECDALQAAVQRLESRLAASEPAVAPPEDRSGGEVGAASAPEWLAPHVDEPAWRRALRRDLALRRSLAAGEVPSAWIVDFVRVAAGVPVVLLPGAARSVTERTIEVDLEDTPLCELLALAVAPMALRAFDGAVYAGTDADLGALDRALLSDRDPNDGEARAFRATLAAARTPFTVEGVSGLEVARFAQFVGELDLWVAPGGRHDLGSCELDVMARDRLGLDTLLLILMHASGTRAALVDGVLVLDAEGAKPLAPLAPEVLEGLPDARQYLNLGETSLVDRLAELSAQFGVELRLAPSLLAELGDESLGEATLWHASLGFMLRTVVHELREREPVRWVRVAQGLQLARE